MGATVRTKSFLATLGVITVAALPGGLVLLTAFVLYRRWTKRKVSNERRG